MAGPVKGTIGQDEVTLNDAATETTLLKMLAAIQKGGGSGAQEAVRPAMHRKIWWKWPKPLAKLPKN